MRYKAERSLASVLDRASNVLMPSINALVGTAILVRDDDDVGGRDDGAGEIDCMWHVKEEGERFTSCHDIIIIIIVMSYHRSINSV